MDTNNKGKPGDEKTQLFKDKETKWVATVFSDVQGNIVLAVRAQWWKASHPRPEEENKEKGMQWDFRSFKSP